jgi:hypothetical protein
MPIQVNSVISSRPRDAGVAMKRAGSVIGFDCQGNRAKDQLWHVYDATRRSCSPSRKEKRSSHTIC